MNMIMSQVVQNLRKNIAVSLLIILIFSGSLFLVGGTAGYYLQSKSLMNTFAGCYGEDTTRALMVMSAQTRVSSFTTAETTRQYYDMLQRTREEFPEIEFYHYNRMQVLVRNYEGPDRLLYGYSDGAPGKVLSNGEVCGYFDCLHANDDFLKRFSINVAEGTDFSALTEQDLRFERGKEYPVILGWNLREYYSIGDTFEVTLMAQLPDVVVPLRVCGFIAEGTAMLDLIEYRPLENETTDDKLIYLDSSMVLPFIDLSVLTVQEPELGRTNYAPELGRADYYTYLGPRNFTMLAYGGGNRQRLLMDLTNWFEMQGYEISAESVMNIPGSLYDEMNEYFDLLLWCGIFIAVTATVCISANIVNRINDNMKKYAVHLICGARVATVRGFAVAEAVTLAVISELIAVSALLLFGEKLFAFKLANLYEARIGVSIVSVALATALAAAVVLISLIQPIIKINRTEYDTLLRGRE